MLSKKYFVFLTAVALFLTGSFAAFAQTAPVRGKVELKKADGTVVPVMNAVIDVYRMDAKGKLPSGKTDKKGSFAFAGLPLGQVFAMSISAPGIRADIFPNVKAGADGLTFTVSEGDGKILTEDEVRAALAGSGTANTQQAPPQESEEAKKAKAENEKQVAEVTAKNKKIEGATAIITAALKDGTTAFEAKNYDLAIAKFDEGFNADPDYAGTAPVLLNNKALALRLRGFDAYKQSTTDAANKASLMEKAKNDFSASADASQKALDILKAAAPDAALQKSYDANKYNALANLTENYRLMILTKADQTKTKEANIAFVEYIAAEPDAAKKSKAQLQLGDIMREAGDSENAITAYRKVLETTPDSADAMAGLGLSLFNVGVSTDNKTQMQEGLNFMQKFADTAPATHPLKASVKDAVDYLKNEEKLTPQKVVTPGKKRT